MVKLNEREMRTYTHIITQVIPYLAPGDYAAKAFFGNEPTVARVVRRLREETVAGNIPRVSLIGSESAEGYRLV